MCYGIILLKIQPFDNSNLNKLALLACITQLAIINIGMIISSIKNEVLIQFLIVVLILINIALLYACSKIILEDIRALFYNKAYS